jgi:hypothetical protein
MSVMSWWGVSPCCNASVLSWMEGWAGLCPSKPAKRAWNLLFCAVLWTIWELRNNSVFDGRSVNRAMALDSIKFRVAWWFQKLWNWK